MIDISEKIKTTQQFVKAIEDMDGLTEREKDVLVGLTKNYRSKYVVQSGVGARSEVSVSVCDDEAKEYGLCLTLYPCEDVSMKKPDREAVAIAKIKEGIRELFDDYNLTEATCESRPDGYAEAIIKTIQSL